MKQKEFKHPLITDLELLTKFFFYIRTLRSAVPNSYLKDSCSGIMALVFNLRDFLIKENLSDYGNIEK